MKKLFEKNRKEIINIEAVGTMLGFMSLVVAGMLLGVDVVHADDTYVSTATITIPSSCSITSTLDTPHTATIPAGIYSGNYNSDGNDYTNGIGQTTIKAFCNDSGGFSIYAIGYTNDTYGNTNLVGPDDNNIATGTEVSGNTSNWAMKIGAVTGTYTPTIAGTYGSYTAVPTTYDKVASFGAVTDLTNGSSITTTYAAYIASNQQPGTYNGKVKYTLVHPSSEVPLQPQTTQAGQICYYPNGSNVEGTMGCQTISASATSATLLASNFSRDGYGFAGWSKTFDYSDPTGFLGPQEYITFTAGEYSGDNNGLSLYAHWVKSEGNLQNWTCPDNATMLIGTVKALTDQRDNETYAIAKLADGKCWMIENLRLDNAAELTTLNTHNPLNDGTSVTLKHNYSDTKTYNTLSASQDPTLTGWCADNSASCDDQSMLFTGNTTNRANSPTTNSNAIYSYGNYYNWYSATAGRGTYSFNTLNNSVTGDLCPAEWHLPKGGNKSNEANNEFWSLVVTGINNGTNPANYESSTKPYYTGTPEGKDASNKMRAYPNNFVYSGAVVGGSVNLRGSSGYLWSSAVYSSNDAYYLYLNSSNVNPGTSNYNKYTGRSVRCVASGV